jgi:hypothetical protein
LDAPHQGPPEVECAAFVCVRGKEMEEIELVMFITILSWHLVL